MPSQVVQRNGQIKNKTEILPFQIQIHLHLHLLYFLEKKERSITNY